MSNWTETMMKFIATHDLFGEIYWSDDLKFFVLCNDVFFWGCSDAEDVNTSSFPLLKQALADAGDIHGAILYCARKRAMRPQGAWYEFCDPDLHALFDACGPPREAAPGNPTGRE